MAKAPSHIALKRLQIFDTFPDSGVPSIGFEKAQSIIETTKLTLRAPYDLIGAAIFLQSTLTGILLIEHRNDPGRDDFLKCRASFYEFREAVDRLEKTRSAPPPPIIKSIAEIDVWLEERSKGVAKTKGVKASTRIRNTRLLPMIQCFKELFGPNKLIETVSDGNTMKNGVTARFIENCYLAMQDLLKEQISLSKNSQSGDHKALLELRKSWITPTSNQLRDAIKKAKKVEGIQTL